MRRLARKGIDVPATTYLQISKVIKPLKLNDYAEHHISGVFG
jgi:hypothetical protein